MTIQEEVRELINKYHCAEDAYIGYCDECQAAGVETNPEVIWELNKRIAFCEW